MSDDQFTKLFKYMAKRFDQVTAESRGKFAHMDTRFDHIMGALDHILKQLETHEQERLATNHQLNRHAKWIGQLAKSTRTKLVPEQ